MRVTARCSEGGRAAVRARLARGLGRPGRVARGRVRAARRRSPHPRWRAAPLGWSGPRMFDEGGAPTGVSCASEGLCVAVDAAGNAFVSANPGSPAAKWSQQRIDAEHALSSVSCSASGLCVAGDRSGRVFASSNPLAGASSWSATHRRSRKSAITGVSCASASLCAATDAGGEVLVSTNPTAWRPAVAAHRRSKSTARCRGSRASNRCAPRSATAGEVAVSTAPRRGRLAGEADRPLARRRRRSRARHQRELPGGGRSRPGPRQRRPRRSDRHLERHRRLSLAGAFTGASCAASGLCVAVGGRGEAPRLRPGRLPRPGLGTVARRPRGSPSPASPACPGGLCVAVDGAGRALVGARPPGRARPLPAPDRSARARATLAGTVAANDSSPLTCVFEYGPSTELRPVGAVLGHPAAERRSDSR